MVYHTWWRDKKYEGTNGQPLDPARSEERSWMQSRTVELIMKEFPDGNGFSDKDWSRCYQQARKEWDEQERTKDNNHQA
jgi:hypothetical protein